MTDTRESEGLEAGAGGERLHEQLAEERSARAEAEASAARYEFVARASAELAESLDYEKTLRTVAALAVPQAADWCAVDLVDDRGDVARLAVQHADPARIQLVHAIQERFPPDPASPYGVQEVVRTGTTQFIREIPESLLREAAVSDEHFDLLSQLQLRSYIVAPLKARGRTFGAITFVHAESGRLYDESDVTLLEDVAKRAGTAIDNAQLVRNLEESHDRLEEQAGELEQQASELEQQAVELELERARLTAIVDNAPVGILIAEAPSGRITFGNRRIEQILRHPILFSGGVHDYTSWEAYHEDGRKVENEEFPLARVLRTGASAGPDEYLYQRGDGTKVWVRVSGAPILDASGRMTSALVVIDDVDRERRTAAEREQLVAELAAQRARLDEILMQTPAFIAVLRDENHVFELANEPYYQMIGHREILGKTVAEALPEVVEQGFMELLDEVWRTGQAVKGVEVPIVLHKTPGGPPTQRILDFVYQPLREVDGTMSGILAHGVDSTDQVLARRAIEEASRAKSDFLATMSHELRTPLNAMIGYADLLMAGLPVPLPEESKPSVQRIELSARHLLELIEEILTFSRVEAGRESVHIEETDLNAIMDEVAAIGEPLTRGQGLSFEVNRPDGAVRIDTDARKLRQILLNLIGNAVKFTESGTISISLSSSDTDAVFEVRDTGIGIAPDNLERIFEPFWQVESERTRRVSGTGLGLTVSRRLTRLMGGDLTVTSEPGRGTTFHVTLPRQMPADGGAGSTGRNS